MFSIILYKNKSENHRVDKTNYLTEVVTLQGTLRESCSVITPSILIEYKELDNSNNYLLLNCNYAYIQEFNRYYYINDIILVRSGLWRLEMSCDTLMSFKNDFLKLSAFIGRQEYLYNSLLPDPKYPILVSRDIQQIKPPLPLDSIEKVPSSKLGVTYLNYYSGLGWTQSSDGTYEYTTDGINFGDKYCVMCVSGFYGNNIYNYLGAGTNLILVKNKHINAVVQAINGDRTFWDNIKYLFDTPNESLLSIKFFPCNFSPIESRLIESNTLYYATGTITLPSDVKVKYFSSSIQQSPICINFGTFEIKGFYNNFLDYEPYTSISLSCPYLGYINLPTDKIMNSKISIYCHLDLTTGMGTFEIISSNGYTQFISKEIGVDLPVTKTNQNDVSRKQVINGIKSVGELAKFGGQVFDAYQDIKAAGGNISPTGKLIGAIVNKACEVTNDYIVSNQYHQQTYLENSDLSKFRFISAFIEISRPKTPSIVDLYYRHELGSPSAISVTLQNIHGYTEVSSIHLDGIPNATSKELEDIDHKLRSGVLLP